MAMKKFFEQMAKCAFVGLLAGVVLLVIWLIFANISAQGFVLLAAILWALIACVVIYHTIKTGLIVFVTAAMLLLLFYASGCAFNLNYFATIGLPADLEFCEGVWLLYPLFGATYWAVFAVVGCLLFEGFAQPTATGKIGYFTNFFIGAAVMAGVLYLGGVMILAV